mmetsp:Transcript_7420/g.15259  ORF Transcript_7420/g.15259 Transcript_7420/m.15259 type:complete len:461 (-) Transcript_7420:188-1570(-)
MSESDTITCFLSLTSAPSAPRVPLSLPSNATASDLRRLASEATNVPLSTLKLIFRGRVIPDKGEGDAVKEFKLEDECVIHVMGKPAASSTGAGATAGATSTGNAAVASAGASVSIPGTTASATTPNASGSPLSAALTTLRFSNSTDVYKTALSTADKLLGNIIDHPMEEKYRSIKKANPAFQRRLGGVTGGEALLLSAGFVVEAGEGGVETYVLRPSAEAWPRLVAAGEEVKKALNEASAPSFSPPGSASDSGLGAAAGAAGGMPNLFPGGMPGTMGGAGMEAAAQSLLSNPQMLQNMLNNPMVQQMMRNDPRFANNPMLQQSMQALTQNPDMMRQMSQLMSDPGMMENMSRMMQQNQQPGAGASNPFGNMPEEMRRQMEEINRLSQQYGGSSGTLNLGGMRSGAASGQSGSNNAQTSSTSGSGTNNSGNNNSNSSAANDSDMTEEEMIAEAIARSLRES